MNRIYVQPFLLLKLTCSFIFRKRSIDFVLKQETGVFHGGYTLIATSNCCTSVSIVGYH